MNKCFSFPAGVVQISRWGNIRSAHVDTERILYERILLLAIADFDMLGRFFPHVEDSRRGRGRHPAENGNSAFKVTLISCFHVGDGQGCLVYLSIVSEQLISARHDGKLPPTWGAAFPRPYRKEMDRRKSKGDMPGTVRVIPLIS